MELTISTTKLFLAEKVCEILISIGGQANILNNDDIVMGLYWNNQNQTRLYDIK